MPQVIFLPHDKFCPDGMVVEAEPGTSILELAHEHHIEMESACGGVCACTTCHCIIREGFDSLKEADELKKTSSIGPGGLRCNRASPVRHSSGLKT
jgi:2Fe-2S ferredoxin